MLYDVVVLCHVLYSERNMKLIQKNECRTDD